MRLPLKGWRVEIGGVIWYGRDAKPVYWSTQKLAEEAYNKALVTLEKLREMAQKEKEKARDNS